MTALYQFVGMCSVWFSGLFLLSLGVQALINTVQARRKQRREQMTPPLSGSLHFRDGSIRLTRATCPDDAIRTLIRESAFAGVSRAPTDRGSR